MSTSSCLEYGNNKLVYQWLGRIGCWFASKLEFDLIVVHLFCHREIFMCNRTRARAV
jgi:hypothetical protein